MYQNKQVGKLNVELSLINLSMVNKGQQFASMQGTLVVNLIGANLTIDTEVFTKMDPYAVLEYSG